MAGWRGFPGPSFLAMPLDGLWRLSARPTTAAALACLLALALAAGLALPQAPAALAGDAQGLGRWLAELRTRHGPWLSWAERAGFLSLHTTVGFHLLWAAAGFTALVAAADGWLAWWRRRAEARLPWHLLAHAGLLALLLAGLAQDQWAASEERSLLGGTPAVVASGAEALSLERTDDGAASGAVSIRWQEGEAAGEIHLQEGRPHRLGMRTLHLTGAGLAVRLRVVDALDQPLPLDDPAGGGQLRPEVLLRFSKAGESRYVSVPPREWLIRVSSVLGGSQFALWVYRGWETTPLAQAAPQAVDEVAVGEYRLRWQVLPYAEITLARNPGLGPGLLGWLLLCAGLAGSAARDARGEAQPWPREPDRRADRKSVV